MANFFGQLDLTNILRLWQNHRELFRMVDFKDGQHALLNVSFNERQQPDDHGNTHYLKADCKKADQREGLSYYISGGFRPSQFSSDQQAAPAAPAVQQPAPDPSSIDALPF